MNRTEMYRAMDPAMWPTPTSRDYLHPNSAESQERRNEGSSRGQQLVNEVAHVAPWPTPTATRHKRSPNLHSGDTLLDATTKAMWRTPSSQEPGGTVETRMTKDGGPVKSGQRAYHKRTGGLAQIGLTQEAEMHAPAMWPTPSVAVATGGQTSRSGDRKDEMLLTGMAKDAAMTTGTWPTPQALGTRALWQIPTTPRPNDNDETAGKDYPSQRQNSLAREATGTTPSGSPSSRKSSSKSAGP